MATFVPPAPATKVVFHPFCSWHCNFAVQHTDSTADPTDSWQKITNRLYKESNEQTKKTILDRLRGPNDTIYIPGQCAAASNDLYSFNKHEKISSTELVLMLKQYLSTEFRGKIKIYACHSGSDSEKGKHSFAKRFASLMRQYGYTECTYFGYEAQVSAYGTQVYKGNANMSNKANQHRWAMSGAQAGQRASAVRVRL